MQKLMIQWLVFSLTSSLLLSSCGFPRAEPDYLKQLTRLTQKVEAIAQQSNVCMSEVASLEYQYGYLAPGKNVHFEGGFTAAEQERFEQLITRLQAANDEIISKGTADC